MSSPALILVQPMQSLPSLLALGDLRRRAQPLVQQSAGDAAALANLLALDPLTVLRAMRLVAAPVHAAQPVPRTSRALVDALGTTAIVRLLDVPEVEPERTRRIRELWRRAIARACAAELLAKATGTMDPAEAYFLGLLRDLDSWLRHLGIHHNGTPPTWRGADLIRHWGLGAIARRGDHTEVAWGAASPAAFVSANPDRLLDAADALATVAGFVHPDRPGADAPVSDAVQTMAETVFEAVTNRFDQLGLDAIDPPVVSSPATEPRIERGSMVPRLLECRTATSYTGLLNIAVAAALRYLEFDRAFVVSWNPDVKRCWVRAKADNSRLPIQAAPVRPTEREADTLADVRHTGEPRILVRSGNSDGLCGHVASDRALVVPLLRDMRSPSFLILDRATSTRPIDVDADGEAALELAGFVTLLVDNMFLRLRRRRAQRCATLDALTGLANRGVGIFTLQRAMAAAVRGQTPLCVMMLDLDDFKRLNDGYGHLVGDQALRLAASVLRRTVRASDTVCRYGGEEFLVILPDTDATDATILATRLFTEVEAAGRAAKLPLTVSIGLSGLKPGDDLDGLVGRADRALYASKSRGRNRFSADTD